VKLTSDQVSAQDLRKQTVKHVLGGHGRRSFPSCQENRPNLTVNISPNKRLIAGKIFGIKLACFIMNLKTMSRSFILAPGNPGASKRA
jgi:hypothetical protein